MGIAEAAVEAMRGGFDKFDACWNYAEKIQGMIDYTCDEVEFHQGDGLFTEPHFCSKNANIHADLERAKELIDEARLICQRALAAV